jgi:hypothetical protein
VNYIKLLQDKGMSFNLTDTDDYTATCFGWMWPSGSNECFVERDVALNNVKKLSVTVLMVAAQSGKM